MFGKPGFERIIEDIFHHPPIVTRVADKAVKIVFGPHLSRMPHPLVDLSGGVALEALNGHAVFVVVAMGVFERPDQEVDVIWHHAVAVQFIEFVIIETEGRRNHLRETVFTEVEALQLKLAKIEVKDLHLAIIYAVKLLAI